MESVARGNVPYDELISRMFAGSNPVRRPTKHNLSFLVGNRSFDGGRQVPLRRLVTGSSPVLCTIQKELISHV